MRAILLAKRTFVIHLPISAFSIQVVILSLLQYLLSTDKKDNTILLQITKLTQVANL